MRADESGSVTIEFVLWVPVFVLILALTVDISILFMTRANLWAVARDTTRYMATGLYSNDDAEDYAAGIVSRWGEDYTIDASRDGNLVTMEISVAMSDVSPINILSLFSEGNIRVGLSQRIEPR